MDLLERGARWHASHMPRAAGRTITYRQGGLAYSLTAWPAMQRYDVQGEDGLLTQVVAFDWSLETNELAVTPRAGDTIEETLNGEIVTYEVLPIGSMPCFEELDVSGIMLLVHTRKLASAS